MKILNFISAAASNLLATKTNAASNSSTKSTEHSSAAGPSVGNAQPRAAQLKDTTLDIFERFVPALFSSQTESMDFDRAVQVLDRDFNTFDNAKNPDSKKDGKIRKEDLISVRDGGDNFSAEQRAAAKYLLSHPEELAELDAAGDEKGLTDGIIAKDVKNMLNGKRAMSLERAAQVLSDNFNAFDTATGSKSDGKISEKDLIEVRDNSKDPNMRAAAEYLLSHPEELDKLDAAADRNRSPDGIISRKDVDYIRNSSEDPDSALQVLYRNFDKFDTAAHPGSEGDGKVSTDDLRAMRDNPNADPELRDAARSLLDNDKLREDLSKYNLVKINDFISRGDIRMFKFKHQHEDLNAGQMGALVEQIANADQLEAMECLSALEQASPEVRQMFYEEASRYALENIDSPEGQRMAAYAMEALSQQPISESMSNLESLQEAGTLDALTSAALKGQVAYNQVADVFVMKGSNGFKRVSPMNGVEKLMENVHAASGYYVEDSRYEDNTRYERFDPGTKSKVEADLFGGVIDACEGSPEVKAYCSQNAEIKDALALNFTENYDALVEALGDKTDAGTMSSAEGIPTFSTFYNVISSPPPSEHARAAIETVIEKTDAYVQNANFYADEIMNISDEEGEYLSDEEFEALRRGEYLSDEEVEAFERGERTKDDLAFNVSSEQFEILIRDGVLLGCMLTSISEGLSTTVTSMVNDEVAADQASKDLFQIFINAGADGVGSLGGPPGAILGSLLGDCLTGIVQSSGGQYTTEDAIDALNEEYELDIGSTNRSSFSDLADEIRNRPSDHDRNPLRGALKEGFEKPTENSQEPA